MASKEQGKWIRTLQKGMKSPAFGRWLRSARGETGLSQAAAASAAGLCQQVWSRMERQGNVPIGGSWLEKICQTVNRSVTEALDVIEKSIINQPMSVKERAARYDLYKQVSMEREKKTDGPVGIFILREDPEPVDSVAIREYVDLLRGTEQTWISILFRYPDPKSWRSFHQLVGLITQQTGEESGVLLKRLRGFYRQTDYAEQREMSLSIIHPYILSSDNGGVDLTLAIFDQYVKQEEMANGYNEPEAAQRSLCMIPQDRRAATGLAQWVGLSSPIDPIANMWVPITTSI